MTFKTLYDYFKYKLIPFRLIYILAIFSENINKILMEKLDLFVIVYLDNILIYIKNKGKNYKKSFNGF